VLTPILLTLILTVLALLVLALAAGSRRVERALALRIQVMDGDGAAARRREQLRDVRRRLDEAGVASERTLWALEQLDERASRATRRLYEARIGLADNHSRLLAARSAVERMRWMMRMLVRINSIRRTVIG
jgi:hypothetical protein